MFNWQLDTPLLDLSLISSELRERNPHDNFALREYQETDCSKEEGQQVCFQVSWYTVDISKSQKNRELMFYAHFSCSWTPQLDSVSCEMEDTAEYKTMCEQQVDESGVNFFREKNDCLPRIAQSFSLTITDGGKMLQYSNDKIMNMKSESDNASFMRKKNELDL